MSEYNADDVVGHVSMLVVNDNHNISLESGRFLMRFERLDSEVQSDLNKCASQTAEIERLRAEKEAAGMRRGKLGAAGRPTEASVPPQLGAQGTHQWASLALPDARHRVEQVGGLP